MRYIELLHFAVVFLLLGIIASYLAHLTGLAAVWLVDRLRKNHHS